MRYKKITSIEMVAADMAETIASLLGADRKVLWLVAGGSATPAAALISRKINISKKLYLTLTDERPGDVDHKESNWAGLKNAGFKYKGSSYYEVLSGESLEVELDNFNLWLENAFSVTDYKIGLLGIGPDGHTAGILPGNTPKLSRTYSAYYDDGQRQRISVTPEAIASLDEAVVYLSGEPKRPIMNELQKVSNPLEFPAQYLKRARKLTVYNDWISGEA